MKNFLFAIAAIFSLVLTSCEKEEPIETQNSFDTLTATIENAGQTKAELAPGRQLSDDVQVKWSDSDAISVFFKKGGQTVNVKYILQSGRGTTTGTFAKAGDIDLENATFLAAVYPYSGTARYNENTKTVSPLVFSSNYTYNSSKHVTSAPMAYIGDANAISFKNAAALVRINITIPAGYDILELSSNYNALAGSYSIKFNSSNEPVAELSSSASNSSIQFRNISAGSTIFFPIIPGEYTDLEVTAKKSSTSDYIKLIPARALTAARNNVYYTAAGYMQASNKNFPLLSNIERKTFTVDFNNISDSDISIEASIPASSKLNIYNTNNKTSFTVNCPNTTVEVKGAAVYDILTATTAENTLILSSGVQVNKLIVKKGNVQVNNGATLNGIELEGVSSVIVTNNGGSISSSVKSTPGVTIIDNNVVVLRQTLEKAAAGSTIKLTDNIEINDALKVDKDLTIDMNGYTITSAGDGFEVTAGTLTITGDGIVKAGSGDQWVAVWANGGNVVIENGTYSVGADGNGNTNDCIYAKGGTITINGGTFSNEGNYVASKGGVVINAHNTVANSKVIINAGTFNPAQGCVIYEDKDKVAGTIVDNRQ